MNVNYVKIGRGDQFLNITNILFFKFDLMLPSVNRVLSFFLRTIATSPSVEKSNSKERVA